MIILACATERECRHALRRILPDPLPTVPTEVRCANHEILVMAVGVGPVIAALRVGEVLGSLPHVRGIVHLGICGSYDLRQADLGQPCVATAEIFPEYGVFTTNPAQREAFAHPMLPGLTLTDSQVIPLAPQAAATALGMRIPSDWTMGPSITVSGVSGTPERAQALCQTYTALSENMEGFSLALAALTRDLPFLEIRTVSNPVGVRDKKQWNFPVALRALESILPILLGESL